MLKSSLSLTFLEVNNGGAYGKKAYRKNGTQDPESTQDPGPYEDAGPYEDTGPYEDLGLNEDPGP